MANPEKDWRQKLAAWEQQVKATGSVNDRRTILKEMTKYAEEIQARYPQRAKQVLACRSRLSRYQRPVSTSNTFV